MVKLEGIQKYFPANGIQALDNAGLELREGEIHALLGENGAGKSTLMHVMAGYVQPDNGNIIVDNVPRNFTLPRNAIKAGIGMVKQDPCIVPGFRVWEDCSVGLNQSRFGFISRTKTRALVKSVSDEWGFDLPVDDSVETLTIGQRQKAAILSLLLKNVKYFILDEATAVLSLTETERLFYLLKKLRDYGKGIIIISHKLEETLSLADHVTVLRNGKLITNKKSRDVSMEELSAYIFDSDKTNDDESISVTNKNIIDVHNINSVQRKTILHVENLSVENPKKPFLRGIDFSVKSGTIIGFAGVKDSGLETLELALAGFLSPKNGTITLNETSIGGQGTAKFRCAGGAYLSGDRTGTAMAYELPLWDSLIIHAHRRFGKSLGRGLGEKFRGKNLAKKFGFLDNNYLYAWTHHIMEKAGIDRSTKSEGHAFSGGMIQKILVQRELAEDAALFILSEPVWGLDRNAAKKVIGELKEKAAQGKSILLFSADLDLLMSASDEIIVLQNGSVSASFNAKDSSPKQKLKEDIAYAMIGAPL